MSADRHFGLSLYEPPPIKRSRAQFVATWVRDVLAGLALCAFIAVLIYFQVTL